jgi:glyoxylate/hydroxypyruvate/2-ketogluconate reductase
MKPGILVTREIFDDVIDFLKQHCEVDANQADVPYTSDALAARLSGRDGVMCALTDRIDAALLARAPQLKAVANIAVGYNNIDVPACSARGIKVTNTPGVLDDSTADLAFALMLAAARRITEVESTFARANGRAGA